MASEKNNLGRRGWFEELYFGVGIAFDRSDPSVVKWLATDVKAGGLLDWTAAAAALQRSDREKAKKARLTAVSYLFESVAGVLLDMLPVCHSFLIGKHVYVLYTCTYVRTS